MKLKFQMNETMKGYHHFVDPSFGTPDERILFFTISWGQSLREFLAPGNPSFFLAGAKGEIFVEGLTKSPVPTMGSLDLSYLEKKGLRYELAFDVDGKGYHFIGEKRDVKLWKPWMLPKTHTTCYGRIEDTKYRVISKSVLHFPMDLKGIMSFLRSFQVLDEK